MIIRPVVSEKSYALIAEGKYTFRVDDRAHKTQIAHAVEEIFDVEVAAGADLEGAREAEAPRPQQRPHASLEEGDRPARPGRTDRAVRGRGDRVGDKMPNRKTKPTSPGRRFATYPLREQLTAREPERKLTEGLRKSGGRNVNGRVTARHRGGGAKRRYRKIDFKRLKDGVPAKVATIEYDPNRSCYIALLHYADGAEALHPRPGAALGRRRGPVRHRRRHQTGQRDGAARDADRHDRPQRRAGPRPGRQARPRRRHRDPAGREGGRDGHPAPALLGDAAGPRRVPRDGRNPLQRRAPEHQDRQGRPQPPQGQAPADPRRRDEPGRPPARRRRGPPHAGRPPGDPVGQADARLQDPQEGQAVGPLHRPRPPARKEEGRR